MNIFEHTNYRTYLRDYIKELPRKGRGELSNIAKHLNVNTTLLSQIMSGARDFNQEQTYSLSLYLGHTELEMEYFSLILQIERASSVEFKVHLRKKIADVKNESLKLSKRISYEKKLSEQQKTVFYSSWIYSAVHIYTSLVEEGVSFDELYRRFGLSKSRTLDTIKFLLSSGIITETSGKYQPGVQSTFVEQGSPHLLKHHSNWRVKAIQKSENLSDTEMMVTGQFSLSKKDFLRLREQLTEFLRAVNLAVKDTVPEEIVCLNIDWFWLDK